MNTWKIIGFIATVIIVLSFPLVVVKRHSIPETDVPDLATFTGSQKCSACHKRQYDLWLESHHARSMAVADEDKVLGDFDNAEFVDEKGTHRFYKKQGKFFVYTHGPGGEMGEFEVSHTFGYTPLQQYLVPFEKGKYQCLFLAWDTEKEKWFNLSEAIYRQELHHDDWLYWTNQAQNWNGMCAECHSTNLKKNYSLAEDSFETTYSEINVACEACHGPGSKHLEWAQLPDTGNNASLIVKTSSITAEQYADLCGRCHSRRFQLGDFKHQYGEILDYMVPTFLGHEYFADGQILEENYVYGSFLQSKMFASDVRCGDCHDAHSGKLYFQGNKLCLQCHTPVYYDTAKHHFHKKEGEQGKAYYIGDRKAEIGEGSMCVNCHMPGRFYMGNDFRNDHSIRVPRVDLSMDLGTPNACNQCHTDKSLQWALDYISKWYGIKKRPHFGSVLAQGRSGDPAAKEKLLNLIDDTFTPLIVRATAIELLVSYQSPGISRILVKYLDDPSPILRLSAARVCKNPNTEQFIKDVAPLLDDPVRAVRTQAAFSLTAVPPGSLPLKYQERFQCSLDEYRKQLEYMADFPAGRFNLGILHSKLGQPEKARAHYELAIAADSAFTPALFNLAGTCYELNQKKDAENAYKQLISKNPGFAEAYYSLGLLLTEEKRYGEAAEYMEIAGVRYPRDSRIKYNLGLIYLQLQDFQNAEKQLKLAVALDDTNYDYLYALAFHYIDTGDYDKAKVWGSRLAQKFPRDPKVIQLILRIRELERK